MLGTSAMTTTPSPQPVPPHGQGVRFDPPHDAQDVADTLRRVTLRAFQAVKPTAPARDRHGVHGDLVQLEAALDDLGLRNLLTYTTALRRRVESVL
jgi:hypothetical protein